MPKRKEKKIKPIYVPKCLHKLSTSDGVILCDKCNDKAIIHLNPLEKSLDV